MSSAVGRGPVTEAEAGGSEVYGLLTLGGIEIALPASALREVVPCPEVLAPLPTAVPGLIGALDVRGSVLPVLDLRAELGADTSRHAGQVVTVVAADGRTIGLLADRARGVLRVPDAAVQPLSSTGGELVFTAAFQDEASGSVVSILDASLVVDRPGFPSRPDAATEELSSAPSDSSSIGTSRPSNSRLSNSRPSNSRGSGVGSDGAMHTLLRCGEYVLAVDIAYVHTTVPSVASSESVLSGGICLGVTEFAERSVAVVDTLALLGLGRMDQPATGPGLVLKIDGNYVVLALNELIELTSLADEDILPIPSFAVSTPALLRGMTSREDLGQVLCLDGAAVSAEHEIQTLAVLNTGRDVEATAEKSAAAQSGLPTQRGFAHGPQYLVYSAGVDLATPLEQITEILPLPNTAAVTSDRPDFHGVFVHRGRAVPVVDLATLLGRPAPPVTEATCLLVLDLDGQRVAFRVGGLATIDRLSWADEHPVPRPGSGSGQSSPLTSARLVRVGEDSRLLPDLDLGALAAMLPRQLVEVRST